MDKVYIKKMHIYGYGKWTDQVFHFDNGLNVIIGNNEAGKSTLSSFIHSILFGFPTNQSSESRYEPIDGSKYGGKIWFEDTRYGTVGVERLRGKVTGDVFVDVEGEPIDSPSFLATFFYKVQKEWYRSIFSFDLDGVSDVRQMNIEKLDRYFLSAGTLGSESFLKEADRLEKKAADLYKPTGRIPLLNQLLKKNETLNEKVDAAKKKNQAYTDLLERKTTIRADIQSLEKKKNDIHTKWSKLKDLHNDWIEVEEFRDLQAKVEDIPKVILGPDAIYELNRLLEATEEVGQKIFETKEKIESNQSTYHVPAFFIHYEKNKAHFDLIEQGLNEKLEDIHLMQAIEERIADYQKIEAEERIHLHLSAHDPIPEIIREDEINELKIMEADREKLKRDMHQLQEAHTYLLYKQEKINKELDTFEQTLWDTERYENYQKNRSTHQKNVDSTTQSTNQMPFIIASVIFGATLLLLYFLNNGFEWLSLIGFPISLYFLLKGSKEKKQNKNQAPMEETNYEEYVYQSQLRKDWRSRLAELDEIEKSLSQQAREQSAFEKKRQALQMAFNQWKKARQIPQATTIEELLQVKAPYEKINHVHTERMKQSKKLKDMQASFQEWSKKLTLMDQSIRLGETPMQVYKMARHYFESIHAEGKRQQEYLFKNKQLKTELDVLNRKEHEWMKKKSDFFARAAVKNEKEFRELYAMQKTYMDNKKRYEELKERFKNDRPLLDEFLTKDHLVKQLEDEYTSIKKIEDSVVERTNEQISIQATIQKLEEDGQYSELIQQRENMKAEIEEVVHRWASYKVASSMIEQTLKYAKKDRLPKMLTDIERYFLQLTNNRYEKVTVKESFLLHRKDGAVFTPSDLSRGTAEQLYVALRFAFVLNVSKKMPLPVIVDEGFVNFDQERKGKVLDLLASLSQEVQVLYFTFEEPALERYQGSKQLYL